MLGQREEDAQLDEDADGAPLVEGAPDWVTLLVEDVERVARPDVLGLSVELSDAEELSVLEVVEEGVWEEVATVVIDPLGEADEEREFARVSEGEAVPLAGGVAVSKGVVVGGGDTLESAVKVTEVDMVVRSLELADAVVTAEALMLGQADGETEGMALTVGDRENMLLLDTDMEKDVLEDEDSDWLGDSDTQPEEDSRLLKLRLGVPQLVGEGKPLTVTKTELLGLTLAVEDTERARLKLRVGDRLGDTEVHTEGDKLDEAEREMVSLLDEEEENMQLGVEDDEGLEDTEELPERVTPLLTLTLDVPHAVEE